MPCRTVLSVLFLLGFAAACRTGGPIRPELMTAGSPPKALVDDVKARWNGATVLTTIAAGQPCSGTALAHPAYVSGDFNGDGSIDGALWISGPQGSQLVAGLIQTDRFAVVEVTAADPASLGLSKRPRGTKYNRPEDPLDLYFSADTLVTSRCGERPVAYIWNGMGFTTQPLTE